MGRLHELNPEQREAAMMLEGPVLVLAGAGTGKTRMITYRIAHMIQSGIAPQHILAVTFTNKAAREMQERVAQLIGKAPRARSGQPAMRPTMCTFHSFCVRVLRRYIDRLGYKRNFVIYDDAEQLGVIKKVTQGWVTSDVKVKPAEWLNYLSRMRNASSLEELRLSEVIQRLCERLLARYTSALKACNAVDFDDLILLTLQLFEEHPEVLEACRDQYRYVMVDEYQDTNGKQFALIKALTGEHRNLCVVGDDDQSIYGWRGAEASNLLNLDEHYPEVRTIKLEQNYRSTNMILSAANEVIRHNPRRKEKALWSQKGRGEPLRIMAFDTEEEEAEAVVESIEIQRMSQRIPWKDQAILFRTNGQSRPLETALRRAKVVYRLVGGQSFFDRREIRDVLAYLKVLLNPDDDISLLRIANVPARGLSDKTMHQLMELSHERHTSVYGVMRHTDVQETLRPAARRSLEDFLGWMEETRQALGSGHEKKLGQWAKEVITDLGYFEDLRRSEKEAQQAENRVRFATDFLLSLDDRAHRYAADGSMEEQLMVALEELTLDQDRKDEERDGLDAVTLITMHSCKGLEYPHVHIVGVERGLLPHNRSLEEGTLDEERRLFYVAITRAMEGLSLSYCHHRKMYGQRLPCYPSPFLDELPADCVEHVDSIFDRPADLETGLSMFSALKASLDDES